MPVHSVHDPLWNEIDKENADFSKIEIIEKTALPTHTEVASF